MDNFAIEFRLFCAIRYHGCYNRLIENIEIAILSDDLKETGVVLSIDYRETIAGIAAFLGQRVRERMRVYRENIADNNMAAFLGKRVRVFCESIHMLFTRKIIVIIINVYTTCNYFQFPCYVHTRRIYSRFSSAALHHVNG
jgi:hypothetical protein